jgi:hypothetical protein
MEVDYMVILLYRRPLLLKSKLEEKRGCFISEDLWTAFFCMKQLVALHGIKRERG